MAEGTTIETGTPAPDAGEPTPTPEPKTFTQDDLNRIVSKEKESLKSRYEAEIAEMKRKDAESKEIERLQGEERLKKEFEIKERELTEAKTKAERALAIANVRSSLASKGYGDLGDMASNFIGQDADATEKNIVAFDQMVQRLVSEKVAGNLAKGAPPESKGASDDSEVANLRKAMGLK